MKMDTSHTKIYQWGHERRFNAYSNYFRKIYGARVQKVSIDAGFTCPNRDGTKGTEDVRIVTTMHLTLLIVSQKKQLLNR